MTANQQRQIAKTLELQTITQEERKRARQKIKDMLQTFSINALDFDSKYLYFSADYKHKIPLHLNENMELDGPKIARAFYSKDYEPFDFTGPPPELSTLELLVAIERLERSNKATMLKLIEADL